MAGNTLLNWEWQTGHVSGNTYEGKHLIPDASIFLSGPALLSQSGVVEAGRVPFLYPMASIQDMGFNQVRNNQIIFEVGAQKAYNVPGKVQYAVDVTGFVLYGPSLLRQLYSQMPDPNKAGGNALVDNGGTNSEYAKYFPTDYKIRAGYGQANQSGAKNKDFFIALAAELFRVPFGICVLIRNSQTGTFGSFYLEEALIDSHSMNIQANETVFVEAARITYTMMLPVEPGQLTD